MAKFIIEEETATKLTLETNPSYEKQPIGCFIFLVLILLITSIFIYAFLNQKFGWGGFFLTGCLAIFLVYKKIYPTIKHIVFDFSAHKIIRFNTIGNRTTASKEILFSQVAKVMHVSRSTVAAVVLLLDQKTLTVNEGTPTETKPLTEKIAGFLDVPIEEYKAMDLKDYGDMVF